MNKILDYILKNIKYPDAGTKTTEESNVLQQIYRDISDQDIYYLYQMMVNMENHIVNTINNVENTKVTLDDLVIYNEMFIHNFDKSSIGSQLYGGTLDIFVISPSGRKYNFDIKTTGTSKMRANNKELIDIFGKDNISAIRDAIMNDDVKAFNSALKNAFAGKSYTDLQGMSLEKAQKNLLSYAT